MKKQLKFWIAGLIIINGFFLASCDDDDDDDKSPAMEKSYTLDPIANSGVSGTVTFRKQNATTTMVIIQLTGTQAGNSHPSHIHSGNVTTGGPVVLGFTPIDGATGRSETTVTALNNGTPITYEELIAFDGHVNVHLSATEISVMLTQGNIGANADGDSGS